uniref:Uncharacterized protein n=1 Tax=Anguilla anguilla TaxID=7936 RepID=A0A0E9QKI8_ANGAN
MFLTAKFNTQFSVAATFRYLQLSMYFLE